MQIKKKDAKLNKSGFTLIEILIVTVIAGMVFTTIYAFYASVVKYNVESRYEVIASNLAQEGMEIIRNRRDQNVLRGPSVNWRDGISDKVCYPRMTATGPVCNGSSTQYISLSAGVYGNGGLEGDTPFERQCILDTVAGNLEVECVVSWDSMAKGGSDSRSVTATSVLTDWYDFSP